MERVQTISEKMSKTPVLVSAIHIVPPEDRIAAARALRDKVPREWHGGWKEFKGRPSPVDILKKSDQGRMKQLWPDSAVALRVLSRVRGLDGVRLVPNAQYGPPGTGVRRLPFDEFRIRKRIAKVTSGTGSELDFPKLAGTVGGQTRITDQPPLIFHPEDVHAPETWAEIEKVLQSYRETLADDRRMLLDRYRLVDVAIKVVGVGSVGRLCSIVLLMSKAKIRCSFNARKQANPCSSLTRERASMGITVNVL